jgi:DNA polymerase-3 subunit beta
MKIQIAREHLLHPLQQVIGAVERRQTLPALANVLLRANADGFSLTGTDLEIELVAHSSEPVAEPGETTLPARKLMDICKALPDGAGIELSVSGERVSLRSGRSRFALASLPVADFPVQEEISTAGRLRVPQGALKRLIERTSFAMANQDVRYYLNGLMLEFTPGRLRAVATDGHRLALADVVVEGEGAPEQQQVILPRKGVLELVRLLGDGDEPAELEVGASHLRVSVPGVRFTSKLVDGRFPDYDRVIPRDGDRILRVDREALRQALVRASILSNEKYRGIRLVMDSGLLRIQAHNPEQEEAEEELEVEFDGGTLEIGFNVNYLLDVLGTLQSEEVECVFRDSSGSSLMREPGAEDAQYVVMPMRL